MIANVLTIAGSDSGGGAGIQADLKTCSALDTYGLSVITALTAQNTVGVQAVHVPPVDFIQEQLQSVFSDIRIDAVKIGMTATTELIACLTNFLTNLEKKPFLVIDPVMVATSGDALLETNAIDALKTQLLPLADVITPNLPEAKLLSQGDTNDYQTLANALLDIGCQSVLLKGGHDDTDAATDYWVAQSGETKTFSAPRVNTNSTHGTGCTLSAAIAASYAKQHCGTGQGSITVAINEAKTYVTRAIQNADKLSVGKGHGPLWHVV